MINKKSMLFVSLGALIFNGCVAKQESDDLKVTYSKSLEMEKMSSHQVKWNKNSLKVSKGKADCVDCYAAPIGQRKPPSFQKKHLVGSADVPKNLYASNHYAKAQRGAKGAFGDYDFIITADDKNVKRSNYSSKSVTPAISSVNSSYNSYPNKTYPNYTSSVGSVSIQVGAFRNYSGAQVYVDRYNRFSNKYKVEIKTGTKNKKPIHRVQIVGFKNPSAAKSFMARNGLSDAFLVK